MEAAVVSGILKIVSNKLAPLLIKEYSSIVGVQKHLLDLKDQVQEVNCWLEAIGDKVSPNNPAFNWLRKLKDIAYDVDDIVDEFQLKAEEHDAHDIPGLVSRYMCKKPKSLILQCKAASKLKAVKKRFDAIVKQRTEFNAIANSLLVGHPAHNMSQNTTNETTLPTVDVASVLGRDQEKHQKISKLVDDTHIIKTISIIGLGGSGKTTLAKLVFNDFCIIEKHFEVRLWIHVSQEFDTDKLIRKLFEAFGDNNPGQHALPYMIKTISDKLTGKRLLLVLDDVWTESLIQWEKFMVHLKSSAPGSRILLTARSRRVAETVRSIDQFDLPFLSLDDSWQLFQQCLVIPAEGLDSEFVKVGREIVKKCGGVPLAIKALAGVVHGMEQIQEWESMRDSNILDVEGKESIVAACLKLSYFHLPSNLKQCFIMCSIFPKGHKIDKEQLIDLWIAHDMITVEVWSSIEPRRCPLETLSLKFKATAKGLQRWSQKRVGHISSQLSLAREIIHQLDIAQDSRALQPDELWLRNSLKKHSLALASLMRTIARSRSRIGWLKEGDANTRLFHMHARHRKRKNFIAKLKTGDRIITAHEEKAAEIFEFYSNLIGTAYDRERTINLDALNIPEYDLEALDIPFTEEEVWKTIKDLPSDKAPGPDGFTGKFYKTCWTVIKEDVMSALHTIWEKKFRNLWMLNSAFITLVPKNSEADQVKDFRPISLVHSFAKLVTKILANRLAGRLDEMVSLNQSAFIKRRFIQDNFMLVQQTVKYLHSQKQPRILLKLDITKAFDSVNWSFLLEVLRKLGFGARWCDLLCGLLSTSSTQVLLNGNPSETIQHRRGLRQGDPLSPMLFILVMDVLNRMITRADEEGILQPLARRSIQHRISLYADDVAIFLQPAAADITLTLRMLQLFGEASGLKTNMQKSNVMPIHCSEENLGVVQSLLPCGIQEFPCKYLGLPLSIKKLTKAQVQPIIDKIADQLPRWKADLMTKAGRVVQVQHVLTAMLVYLAMAIELPPWAIKAIDKIRRAFLWRGRKEANGGHCLIAWPKVCRSKELGGLGIADLKSLGFALRARWPWLRKSEPNKPWASLPLQVSKDVDGLISMAVYTDVGDGASTLFWKDRWLDGKNIEELAPKIFCLVPKRTIGRRTVAEALTDEKWIDDIRVGIPVEALMEYLELWDKLANVELHEGAQDKPIWRLSASGEYTAKSAYDAFFQGAIYFKPYERIWKSWAPPKCRFSCGWLLITGAGQLTGWLGEDFLTRPNVYFVTKNKKTLITS